MERVSGIPMDDFAAIDERGVDGEMVLRRGAKVWAEAVMVHGPFHGDMHAGNIWVLDDGRGCYLDFGIMGELTPEWRGVVRDLFYTCMFDLDFTRVARAYRSVGVFPPDVGTDEEIGAAARDVHRPGGVERVRGLSLGDLITSSVDLMKTYERVGAEGTDADRQAAPLHRALHQAPGARLRRRHRPVHHEEHLPGGGRGPSQGAGRHVPRIGSSTWSLVPAPGALSTSSVPPSASARSAMPRIPLLV